MLNIVPWSKELLCLQCFSSELRLLIQRTALSNMFRCWTWGPWSKVLLCLQCFGAEVRPLIQSTALLAMLRCSTYVLDPKTHRVGRVQSFFSSRRNWDCPQPITRRRVCPPPLVPGGGAHSLPREGVGGSKFRRGDIHYGNLCIYVLCEKTYVWRYNAISLVQIHEKQLYWDQQ